LRHLNFVLGVVKFWRRKSEMFKRLKKKYQKQLNRFHDFYFGIKPEASKSTDMIVRADKVEVKRIEPVEPLVKKGERYYFVGDDRKNPFRQQNSMSVVVKDVKEGYVLYSMNNGIFNNESTTIEQFLRMYELKIIEEE
jgi:hypothetical protein